MTSGWTDSHRRVAVAFIVGFSATLVGLAEDGDATVWVVAAVAAVAVASLVTDAVGGLVVGLAAAAAVIGARRVVGPWGPEVFWWSFVQTAALLATGVASGVAGTALRHVGGADGERAASLVPEPVFGSLGLLDGDMALARLEEEVERAIGHGRPLTLALFEVEVIDDSLDGDGRRAAFRSVARALEGRLGDQDVPFATAFDRLGAILPETDVLAAWERVGRVLDAVTQGYFTVRADGSLHRLSDAARVHVGLADLDRRTGNGAALLDAATVAVRQSRGLQEPIVEDT